MISLFIGIHVALHEHRLGGRAGRAGVYLSLALLCTAQIYPQKHLGASDLNRGQLFLQLGFSTQEKCSVYRTRSAGVGERERPGKQGV